MRATGLPAPRRLRLEHAWVQARFAECIWPMFGARFRRSRYFLVETVPGRPGTPKQVVRTFWAKRFGRNVLGDGTTFCIWGWVLGRAGLAWAGLGAGRGWLAGLGWAGLGWAGLGWAGAAGLLGCWAAGLLGCWAAGLLGCWAAGLLGCWAACWAAGLLGCWAAGLLGCWAAGLLGCWGGGVGGLGWAGMGWGGLGGLVWVGRLGWAAGLLGCWAAGLLGWAV